MSLMIETTSTLRRSTVKWGSVPFDPGRPKLARPWKPVFRSLRDKGVWGQGWQSLELAFSCGLALNTHIKLLGLTEASC